MCVCRRGFCLFVCVVVVGWINAFEEGGCITYVECEFVFVCMCLEECKCALQVSFRVRVHSAIIAFIKL